MDDGQRPGRLPVDTTSTEKCGTTGYLFAKTQAKTGYRRRIHQAQSATFWRSSSPHSHRPPIAHKLRLWILSRDSDIIRRMDDTDPSLATWPFSGDALLIFPEFVFPFPYGLVLARSLLCDGRWYHVLSDSPYRKLSSDLAVFLLVLSSYLAALAQVIVEFLRYKSSKTKGSILITNSSTNVHSSITSSHSQ